MLYLFSKFHENPAITFWIIMLTSKQTKMAVKTVPATTGGRDSYTHKSGKTHTGNVFLYLPHDFDLLSIKEMSFQGLMVEFLCQVWWSWCRGCGLSLNVSRRTNVSSLSRQRITMSWSREADVSVLSWLFASRARDVIFSKFCKPH